VTFDYFRVDTRILCLRGDTYGFRGGFRDFVLVTVNLCLKRSELNFGHFVLILTSFCGMTVALRFCFLLMVLSGAALYVFGISCSPCYMICA
jgi:hypothetical protein